MGRAVKNKFCLIPFLIWAEVMPTQPALAARQSDQGQTHYRSCPSLYSPVALDYDFILDLDSGPADRKYRLREELMDFTLSPKVVQLQKRVSHFINEYVYP